MKTKFAAGKSRLLLFLGALLSARALTVTAFYLSGCRRKERDGQSLAGCRI